MSDDNEWFVPVERDGATGESTPSISFMVHGLLSSRVQTGMSDEDRPEEDVNIYLAHLLSEYLRPQHSLRIQEYVSHYDSSVFERVRTSTNTRFRYTVYKANADHILMMMGVFHNPGGGRPSTLPRRIDDETVLGRGRAYYDYAFTYSRCLHGRSSAITGVLGKLAFGFERYLRLLMHLRGEYLKLIDHLSPGDLFHLERGVLGIDVSKQRDLFLDAYVAWRRDPTPLHREQLLRQAAALHQLDPEFDFKLPED
ncbi:MAG TPA: hypothetical protein VFD07_07965 [Candidatus Krumholzibacteria bacterium]|nr:hypothetical protein [Candidatus Krumholzibacteria bacterium]